MRVKDIVNTHVFSVVDTLTVKEALEILVKKKYNGLLVLNEEGKLVGIFSLQDIAGSIVPDEMKENTALAEAMYRPNFFKERCQEVGKKKIYQVMRKEFVTVSPETSLMTIAADFLKNDLYLIPVCEGERVVGIVTRSEIKKALVEGMDLHDSSEA